MTCQEFLALLDADGAAVGPAALDHARSCPTCGCALARWRDVQRELRAMGEEASPDFLPARVMASVRAERADRPLPVPVGLSWRARLAPVLAVVVLASLGGWALWQSLRGTGTPIQEARVAATAHVKHEAAGALADHAAPAPAAAHEQAPAAPATLVPAEKAPPRAADKRGQAAGKRELGTVVPGFAPEPTGAKADASGAEREAPRVVGGVVGGILAAAPQPAPGAAPAAESVAAPVDRQAGLRAVAAVAQMKAKPSDGVLVHLTSADGITVLSAALGVAEAPPPATWWSVGVADDGAITLRDAAGRDIGAGHTATLAFLRGLRLAPGLYRLSR